MRYSVSKLKISIVNRFPFLSSVSRYSKALNYSLAGVKESYAQNGEDKFVLETLREYFPSKKYNYVDVGGFHPMLLSNTYLMYRNNMNGVVIEPNPELVNLHRIFRPHDIQLPFACGRTNMLTKFYLQKTFPALSSLSKAQTNKKVDCQYMAVLELDTIISGLEIPEIYFLSIDVEGFDYDVLLGGKETLRRSFLVCIECNSDVEEQSVCDFLKEQQFEFLKKIDYNLFFKNSKFLLETTL